MNVYRKRFKRTWRRFLVSRSFRYSIWLPLLFILFGVLIWGTNIARVQQVSVEGQKALQEADIIRVAKESIQEPLLGPFFPGNIVAFPKARTAAALQDTFPRIETIAITRSLWNGSVHLVVTERKTHGIYCVGIEEVFEEEATETDEETMAQALTPTQLGIFPKVRVEACFLMDADGIAFADAPETEGSLIMTIIDSNVRAGDDPVFHGARALDPSVLHEINITWETFTQGIDVKPRRVMKRTGGIITIETFEGWEAILSLENPLEPQVVALRELLAKELDAVQRRTISVIDLRVPGRIYYR